MNMANSSTINNTFNQDELTNWKHSAKWLLFLGPFFFISYGFANELASSRSDVLHIVFSWEQSIPFIPWTIIPYWSIDILYALSVFICTTKIELNSHAKRLLTAQIIAVTCFIVFPMGFSFERPETSGLYGYLFTALSTFDQPFNQAPSLHITFLVILWVLYPRHLPKYLVLPFHILCILIGISILTTYQHHFIDVPTGALLGWFCIWLWPEDGHSMLTISNKAKTEQHRHLVAYYLTTSLCLGLLAYSIKGWALWLLWPMISLAFIALFYAFIGAKGFQKTNNGTMSIASQWLLFPYLLGAKFNSYLWTRKHPSTNQILDGLWLGSFPSSKEIKDKKYHTIIDMTAEMLMPSIAKKDEVLWYSFSNLDLLTPSENHLLKTAKLIEQHRNEHINEPILITCALGYSRSVLAIMTWLLLSQQAKSIEAALDIIRNKHPRFVLKPTDYQQLRAIIIDQNNYDFIKIKD